MPVLSAAVTLCRAVGGRWVRWRDLHAHVGSSLDGFAAPLPSDQDPDGDAPGTAAAERSTRQSGARAALFHAAGRSPKARDAAMRMLIRPDGSRSAGPLLMLKQQGRVNVAIIDAHPSD